MKRFILFAGAQYYPSCGLGDYCGNFETLDEAVAVTKGPKFIADWWTVAKITEDDLEEVASDYTPISEWKP